MDFATMMDIFGGSANGLKTVAEAVKTIKEARSIGKSDADKIVDSAVETLRDSIADLQQKQLELQSFAMALSQQNTALLDQERAVRAELDALKRFDAERENYTAVSFALNTSAYCDKEMRDRAHDAPLLCPNCFEKFQKTYLSFVEHALHTKHLQCSVCGSSVHVARDENTGARLVPVNRPRIY